MLYLQWWWQNSSYNPAVAAKICFNQKTAISISGWVKHAASDSILLLDHLQKKANFVYFNNYNLNLNILQLFKMQAFWNIYTIIRSKSILLLLNPFLLNNSLLKDCNIVKLKCCSLFYNVYFLYNKSKNTLTYCGLYLYMVGSL